MKEEISENAVKVRRKSGRAMAVVLTLNREVIRITCAYGPQSGRRDQGCELEFELEFGLFAELELELETQNFVELELQNI